MPFTKSRPWKLSTYCLQKINENCRLPCHVKNIASLTYKLEGGQKCV